MWYYNLIISIVFWKLIWGVNSLSQLKTIYFYQKSCTKEKSNTNNMSVSKQSSYEKPFRMRGQILAVKLFQKLISNGESKKNVSEQKPICLLVTHSITFSFKWLGSKKTHGAIALSLTLHATSFVKQLTWFTLILFPNPPFLALVLVLLQGLVLPWWASVLCWKVHIPAKQLLNCKLVTYCFYLARGWHLWIKNKRPLT